LLQTRLGSGRPVSPRASPAWVPVTSSPSSTPSSWARGACGPGSRHETCPPTASGPSAPSAAPSGADFIGRLVESGATAIAVELLSRDPRQQVELMTDPLLPVVT